MNTRQLAPWSRKALDLDAMAAEGEDMHGMRGKPAIYHCISRVVGQERLFGDKEKARFVQLMRVYEKFCQVRVLTFCVMSNHFHILLEVPEGPEDRGACWSDKEFLVHLSGLYHGEQMAEIRWRLGHYREQGWDALAEEYRNKFFARMWDLSAFMKVLKQRFTQWYNRVHERSGYLWGQRFKSVLVEGGQAARTVAAYIDLNPVRAGIVGDPKDYPWSGYGEALAGKNAARCGLRQVFFEEDQEVMDEKQAATGCLRWSEVARAYRMLLFIDGERDEGDREKGRCGIAQERVAEVLKSGGRLSEGEMLYCRVRYFVDGAVVGREGFVNRIFAMTRTRFGRRRKDGARKMRQVDTKLRTMRDLRREALGP